MFVFVGSLSYGVVIGTLSSLTIIYLGPGDEASCFAMVVLWLPTSMSFPCG